MKAVFSMVSLVLTALVVFQGYTVFKPKPGREVPAALENTILANTGKPAISHSMPLGQILAHEKVIIHRNLFKVKIDRDGESASDPGNTPVPPVLLEKTRLKLALWGTVAGDKKSDGWAVIEDLNQHRQALYRIGDLVQGGEIKSISRNLVVLTVNGEDEVLEASTPKQTRGKPLPPAQNMKNKFLPKPGEPQSPPGDNTLSTVFQTLKTRTYFKDGRPEGLLVFGIRPGAKLQALGLKNGDIIRSVNGIKIQRPGDINTIAGELDDSLDTQISLYRRGNPKELIYYGQEQTFTIESAKE